MERGPMSHGARRRRDARHLMVALLVALVSLLPLPAAAQHRDPALGQASGGAIAPPMVHDRADRAP